MRDMRKNRNFRHFIFLRNMKKFPQKKFDFINILTRNLFRTQYTCDVRKFAKNKQYHFFLQFKIHY